MIMLEIYHPAHTRLEKERISQDSYKVGRHSSNDLVITDAQIPLFWFELNRTIQGTWSLTGLGAEKECRTQFEINFHGYKVKVTNLAWLDEQASPRNAETKTGFSLLHRIGIIPFWIAFNAFCLLYERMMSADREDWTSSIGKVLAVNLLLLVIISSLAILSQAVNKQYRVLEITKAILMAYVVAILVNSHLLGVGWLLGSWAHHEVTTNLIVILLPLWFLYKLSEIIFDHASKKWRLGLLGFIAILTLFFLFENYLPTKDEFEFFETKNPPLMYPLFERNAVAVEEFTSEIQSHMQAQSAFGNQLKEKMNSK